MFMNNAGRIISLLLVLLQDSQLVLPPNQVAGVTTSTNTVSYTAITNMYCRNKCYKFTFDNKWK
jgi:hypothetical protein